MTKQIPPVIRAAWVDRTPVDAFLVFTDEIGAWWPLPSHGMFGDEAGGLSFRDGLLVEQSVDGSETVWGEVLVWEPPNRLVITWHPGRDADLASQVEVIFEAEGQGTRVVLEHRGWEAFGEDAMAQRHNYIGPNAWGGVLDHYSDGAEDRPDGIDLSSLVAAYDAFFAQADQGGFGPPPTGEWDVDQVLAHVTLNDAAILAVCQAIIHQKNDLTFANQLCQKPDMLAAWVNACGSTAELLRRGRVASTQVLAAIARLSPAQLETPVACYLTHDGEVAIDQSAPWQAIVVGAQANVHLPAHIEQLANLRP